MSDSCIRFGKAIMRSVCLGAALSGLGLLTATPAMASATATTAIAPAEPGVLVAQAEAVDFGDDTSDWANDGECDDPRFEGSGAATTLLDTDRGHDATDCRTLFEAGDVSLADDDEAAPVPDVPMPQPDTATIDFGDDSGDWANDGECDDPRFAGTGMAVELLDADIRRDASDCRALFESGDIALAEDGSDTAAASASVDFGDDTSEWANDAECDDPRFVGTGMAVELLEADRMHDATDCRALYESGDIALIDDVPAENVGNDEAGIDFGDDSSTWAKDGECDDPRFVGEGMATDPVAANLMADAADCSTAYESGSIALIEAGDLSRFDFGDDSGDWSGDGECDDPRFTGPGMAKKVLIEDIMRDAGDCSALVETGDVAIKPVYDPAHIASAPYDSGDVDFGDNTSSYANDGVCDDPRFEGPGAASILLDGDELRDAADCRDLFEAGRIALTQG